MSNLNKFFNESNKELDGEIYIISPVLRKLNLKNNEGKEITKS